MEKNNEVIKNLWRKKELLEKGDSRHENIKPLLLILSGGNRGVISSAACYALQSLGLGNVFDTVVGISTGAWVGGYFLAGLEQIKVGVSIYYEDFASADYISFRRIPNIMNASVIENTTSKGPKKLDIDAVINSRTNFFAGVTDMLSGAHFINVKEAEPSPWKALFASSANPLAYRSPIVVNGTEYLDGGVSMPFPMCKVLKEFDTTDILVLTGHPFGHERTLSLKEIFFVETFLRHFPPSIRRCIMRRHSDFHTEATVAEGYKKIFVLWSEYSEIKTLTKDPKKLRTAAVSSLEQTFKVFGKPNLEAKLY